jgi:hypothetical protein
LEIATSRPSNAGMPMLKNPGDFKELWRKEKAVET